MRCAIPCWGSSSSEDPEKTWRWASKRPAGDLLGKMTYESPLSRTPDLMFGWKGSLSGDGLDLAASTMSGYI